MEYKRELLFKMVVLGDYGVGKTSIIKRYAEDTFSNTYKVTIGADFALKTIDWDRNTRINLQLWDISGHERFGLLTSVYYRYAMAAAVVFDLTRPSTFHSVDKWITDLRGRLNLPKQKAIPIILLANKGDIANAQVDLDFKASLNDYCHQNNIVNWHMTSAKRNINLDNALKELMEVTLQNVDQNQNNEVQDFQTISLNKNRNSKRGFCFIN